MTVKKRLLKELGFIVISILLVVLFTLLAGTFFGIWIRDLKLMVLMALVFYLIIGFYRFLNSMARKYRQDNRE